MMLSDWKFLLNPDNASVEMLKLYLIHYEAPMANSS